MNRGAAIPALAALIVMTLVAACTQADPTPAPVETSPLPGATTTATPTAAPTLPNIPRLGQGPSRLLELMKKFPASFKEQGMWFADYGRALELDNAPRPRSFKEYASLSKDERDAYDAARRGLVLRADLLEKARTGAQQWEEAFGFGMFDMDLLVSIGSYSADPLQLAYLEGDFRKEAIRERLLNLGYQERFVSESVYYAIRGDYEADIRDPAGRRALSSMNRVFVEDGTLVAAPDTDRVLKVMEHSAGGRPALADEAMFSNLAASLGDPLSAALLTRSAAVKLEGATTTIYPLGVTPPAYETPEEWGTLHQWEAVGAGYVIADGSTWWGLSLFYSNPNAAGADAEELVRRMTGHKTAISLFYQEPSEEPPAQQPKQPFAEFCSSLAPSVRSDENGSTLTAWCRVGDNPIGNQWWSAFLRMRDLSFLLR